METVAPYKEIIEVITANGGDGFRSCFRCGLMRQCLSMERFRDLQHAQAGPPGRP